MCSWRASSAVFEANRSLQVHNRCDTVTGACEGKSTGPGKQTGTRRRVAECRVPCHQSDKHVHQQQHSQTTHRRRSRMLPGAAVQGAAVYRQRHAPQQSLSRTQRLPLVQAATAGGCRSVQERPERGADLKILKHANGFGFQFFSLAPGLSCVCMTVMCSRWWRLTKK